jgi:hypothetical protein
MADQPMSEADRVKLTLELCKIRIEEYDRNYFSLRAIEWRLVAEFLAGQALLATAHHTLSAKYSESKLLFTAGVCLPIALVCLYLFLALNVQSRLRSNRPRRDAYIQLAHDDCEVPRPTGDDKKHRLAGRYAIAGQTALHLAAAACVVTYVIATKAAELRW